MKRNFAELFADPKHPKSNHLFCKRCGKMLYAPNPSEEDKNSWGVFAYTVLAIAYLHINGWRTIRNGEFNGYFCCPDCLTEKDTEFRQPVPSVLKAMTSYKEWIAKMREKYNYYEN